MKSIIPDEDQEEIPVGFAIVGHVGMIFSVVSLKFANQMEPI